MKPIFILLIISGILFSGCSAEVPPIPQITESPEPSSAEGPSSPPPTNIPHFDISLVRYGGTITRGVVLRLGGEVRNDSTTPLKHMVVVITSYDEDDNITGPDEQLINCEALQPGETCAFSVTFNKRWFTEYCEVAFRLSEGEDILALSIAPDVPASLDVPYEAEEEFIILEGSRQS